MSPGKSLAARISCSAFHSEPHRFANIILILLCSSHPTDRGPLLQTNMLILMFQYLQTLRKNWRTVQPSWERQSSWLAKLRELPSHLSAGTKVWAARHEILQICSPSLLLCT